MTMYIDVNQTLSQALERQKKLEAELKRTDACAKCAHPRTYHTNGYCNAPVRKGIHSMFMCECANYAHRIRVRDDEPV